MKGVSAEYDALRHHAGLLDRTARVRIRFSGPRALETVAGLVTNDVGALEVGTGMYAAALTPKGKIVADVRCFRVTEADLLVDCAPAAGAGFRDMVRKYVNPRVTPYRDEQESSVDFGVFGPDALRVVHEALGPDPALLAELPDYAQVIVTHDDVDVVVARVPDAGVPGFEVIAPRAGAEALHERLRGAGATTVGDEAWSIVRIEAGRAEWGSDMDDSTLPQEANFDDLGAISYTKGCYVGQEVVARLHFRGHVNRRLLGVQSDTAAAPPREAVLLDELGKQVGDVRSAVSSPRLGGIALAMIRREVVPGSRLLARWSDGELAVTARALPFLA